MLNYIGSGNESNIVIFFKFFSNIEQKDIFQKELVIALIVGAVLLYDLRVFLFASEST